MDQTQIISAAARWAVARGWGRKLAKQRAYQQTLLEHSLIEVDVLLAVLPILSRSQHYNLSVAEQKILIVAVLAHDIGKETDEWQAYARNPQPGHTVSHIAPELTRDGVPVICTALGFESLAEPVQRIMAHCVEFHHSGPGRGDSIILQAMLTAGSDRFLTLAALVKAIDHFCSAATSAEAVGVLERDPTLGLHLRAARHELVVRGVSTTFLHRAVQDAFKERGWRPLLYFYDATVYGADPIDRPAMPTIGDVKSLLEAQLDVAISRDVVPLIVGSPTGNVLPKPDLLSFKEARQYLRAASEKLGRQGFASAYQREKKHVQDRGRPGPRVGKGKLKADVVREYWQYVGKNGSPYSADMDRDAGRISIAYPEMMVFKFFKAMMDPAKVEAVGGDGARRARFLYEEVFSPGSWSALQSTSTLDPAKDMARTIDYFWALPGRRVGHPEVQDVAELPDETRLEVLIDLLVGIAQEVYTFIARPSPREGLAAAMASAFSGDLLRPAGGEDVRLLAQRQLEHYCASKPYVGKESPKGIYLCPICNIPFDANSRVKASADYVDNPKAHTNRGIAHGPSGYVMICTTCYYERLLLQVLLGGRPKEIILLAPRLNLGPLKGEELVARVRNWVERAKAQMRGEYGSPEYGFSLGSTHQAARQLRDRDPSALQTEELVSLFTYRLPVDMRKKRRAEALRRLREEFDDDLEALSVACAQPFSTWEAAVEALERNKIVQQEIRLIRKEVFQLDETIQLVCQTPNVVFVPLSYEVASGNDESEVSKAIRRLYVSILLSLAFDASVAICKEDATVDLLAPAAAAYVPPVPDLRALLGCDWLPILEARRWLSAIGAASLLARDTGLSPRSAIYRVLTEDPPERIVRRIEAHLQKQRRSLSPKHLRLIEQLPKLNDTMGNVWT